MTGRWTDTLPDLGDPKSCGDLAEAASWLTFALGKPDIPDDEWLIGVGHAAALIRRHRKGLSESAPRERDWNDDVTDTQLMWMAVVYAGYAAGWPSDGDGITALRCRRAESALRTLWHRQQSVSQANRETICLCRAAVLRDDNDEVHRCYATGEVFQHSTRACTPGDPRAGTK